MTRLLWPKDGDPGRFKITCSCGRWQAAGTVAQINDAATRHDDSPGSEHIVTIAAKLEPVNP